MAKNSNLHTAKVEKNDEFYTRFEDIEREVMEYRDQFENKTVLCNCDDPEWSNFWKFFHQNFYFFKLKKLISTHYVSEGSSYAMIFDGTVDKKIPLSHDEQVSASENFSLFEMCDLKANGDFRSEECKKFLEEADIVVTNPPFSLFREFIHTLEDYGKKYMVIGNKNAIAYKEVFPLIKENKMWLGITSPDEFITPEGNITKKVNGLCRWFTNMDNKKRHEGVELWHEYNEKDYPKYDNYDAINVDKVCDIPCDYYGVMGVPITFLDKYNPEQFEIIGLSSATHCGDVVRTKTSDKYNGYVQKNGINIASPMPIMKTGVSGGTKCTNKDGDSYYQLYWRMFIRRIVK